MSSFVYNLTILLVCRGIGMERYEAPRLRFCCRPELVIVDLKPVGVNK